MTQEREFRMSLWQRARELGGPSGMKPQDLNALGVIRGEQGVFRDLDRTRALTPSGVALGLRHTGRTYADDLTDDEAIYHFPKTKRPVRRDTGEIESLHACLHLVLPVFVVVPHSDPRLRDIRLGWVRDCDESNKSVLVTFSDAPPGPVAPLDIDAPFALTTRPRQRRDTSVMARPNQLAFRYEVMKRCGWRCAVCPIAVAELLQAAHIVPVSANGTDDPRNGVCLCHTHHMAFDRLLFSVNPESRKLVAMSKVSLDSLGIASDQGPAWCTPHTDALQWHWDALQASERSR